MTDMEEFVTKLTWRKEDANLWVCESIWRVRITVAKAVGRWWYEIHPDPVVLGGCGARSTPIRTPYGSIEDAMCAAEADVIRFGLV